MFKFFVRLFNKPVHFDMFNKTTIIHYCPTIIVNNNSEKTDIAELVRAAIDPDNKLIIQTEPLQNGVTPVVNQHVKPD
ncbi:MAG: hypothetical protein LBC20_03045 [Planctomycetaceae bacterium]|nr:hypothetical protein [Planctomycetaceae bacterium]